MGHQIHGRRGWHAVADLLPAVSVCWIGIFPHLPCRVLRHAGLRSVPAAQGDTGDLSLRSLSAHGKAGLEPNLYLEFPHVFLLRVEVSFNERFLSCLFLLVFFFF